MTVTQFEEVMRFDPNPLIRALRHEYDRIFMHGLSMPELFAFHCTEKNKHALSQYDRLKQNIAGKVWTMERLKLP